MKNLAILILAILLSACAGSVAQSSPGPVAQSPAGPVTQPSATGGSSTPSPSAAPGSIDPLSEPEAFTPGDHAKIAAVADVPPGLAGQSIQASITDLPAGTPSENQRNVQLDLSGYGDAATLKVWVKASSFANLRTVYVLFKSETGFAAYETMPRAVGTWQEISVKKGTPASGKGIDWARVLTVNIRADASSTGPYSGQVLWRDLRLTH